MAAVSVTGLPAGPLLEAAAQSPGVLASIPPTDSPVDMERLLEFSGGSPENVAELIGLWVKQTTDQLGQIHLAAREGVTPSVGSIAHSCAGASATCGMMSIVPWLRQLEQLALDGDLAASGPILQKIDDEFVRIKQFLDKYPNLLSAA
jgi:HPt (histidine-containing phosphotransfer) domain-containing protein